MVSWTSWHRACVGSGGGGKRTKCANEVAHGREEVDEVAGFVAGVRTSMEAGDADEVDEGDDSEADVQVVEVDKEETGTSLEALADGRRRGVDVWRASDVGVTKWRWRMSSGRCGRALRTKKGRWLVDGERVLAGGGGLCRRVRDVAGSRGRCSRCCGGLV